MSREENTRSAMHSPRLRGRKPVIIFFALFIALSSAAATGASVSFDESVTQALPEAEEADAADLLPSDAQFKYRDQSALRLAEAADEEPQDLTLTVADDFDDKISSLLIRHPSLPSILGPVAAISYIHLLYLTSVSRSYLVETLQLLAFACFPTLPLIQLISNAHKTTLTALRARNARGPRGSTAAASFPPVSYVLAGLGGMYAFRRSESFTSFNLRRRRVSEYPVAALQVHTAQPVRSLIYPLELVGILLEFAAACLGLVLAVNVPQRSDWDLASVGVDQRAWWTALGGLIASLLCLMLHLSNRAFAVGGQAVLGSADAADETTDSQWRPKSMEGMHDIKGKLHALPAAPPLEGTGGSLLWESTVLSEIVIAALMQDAAVAWSGGSYSLVGLLSIFLANRIVLGVFFLMGLIFNRVVRRYATLRLGGTPGAGFSLNNEQLARKRRWEALLRPLFVVFSCAVCGSIIFLQIVTAVEETMVGTPASDGVRILSDGS